MKLSVRGKTKATSLVFATWPSFWGIKLKKAICPLGGDEIQFIKRWYLPSALFISWAERILIAIRREAWRQGISVTTELR